MLQTIQPRSGTAFTMKKGERLKVIDPEGEQVADLYAFNEHDKNERPVLVQSAPYCSQVLRVNSQSPDWWK